MAKTNNGLTRTDMVTIISNKTDVRKDDVDKVLTCFFNTVITELSKDHSVRLTGFGTFENTTYKSRKFKSPITGTAKELAERVVPRYKPAQTVKEKVNKKVTLLRTEGS